MQPYFPNNLQIGRLNLLTPTRVAAAAKEYIKDGDIVSLKSVPSLPSSNLPSNLPPQNAFH